jgi:MFS family permease
MLALLRRRDFGLLWFAGLISIAGDWILYAALPFFVYERTGSTIATAGMIVAQLAPSVLLGSFAGVFVDRWDRKRILVVANLLHAAAVALLLLVPGEGSIWIVYVVAAAQSAIVAFAGPAETALLPTLVGDGDLLAANALNSLNNRLGRLAGAPVGGALLGLIGLEAVVAVDCASFLVAALLIAPIHTPRPSRPESVLEAAAEALPRTSFWSEWVDGLRTVRRDRTIALLFLVLGLGTFGGTMLDPLYAAWVRDELGEGAEVFGLLLTTHAAFGIAGSLVVGRYGGRLSDRSLIGWSSIVAGLATFVKFNVPTVPVAVSTSTVTGVTSVASNVGVETLAMRTVPEDLRGRVFGLLQATMFLLSLLGAMTGGALAEVVGIVPMLNVAAALIVLSGLIVLHAVAEDPACPPKRKTADQPGAL